MKWKKIKLSKEDKAYLEYMEKLKKLIINMSTYSNKPTEIVIKEMLGK